MNEHQTIGGNIMQLVEMGPGKGVLLKQIIEVRIWIKQTNEKFGFFFIKILRQRKYVHAYTFFALYETNPLMRRRQAEILLGRSVG